MKHYILLYIATLIIMGALDALWLGAIASDFYKGEVGSQFEFAPLPAILFYLAYVAGIVIFVNGGTATRWQEVALYGALFGFFAYATYDLTNLATLRLWTLKLALVDIAWGIFNTAVSSTVGWLIVRRLHA